ncbi:trypsin-like serine peptidase [Gimesia chilikensis]|uniref:trypsin-like serine peptidase n=1 Tax=Gimesia chilikensis TaxID=2605989 RepID=UPI003A8E8BA4
MPYLDVLRNDEALARETLGKLRTGSLPVRPDLRFSQVVTFDKISAVITDKQVVDLGVIEGGTALQEFIRPALFVQNGSYQVPLSEIWKQKLSLAKENLERAIASTGRIEVKNHDSLAWVGTGWLVAPEIMVTNRHVAIEFARKSNTGFRFRKNRQLQPMSAHVDFREEHHSPLEEEFELVDVLYIEPGDDPDLAFFQVQQINTMGAHNPATPLQLAADVAPGTDVAAIGYPRGTSGEQNWPAISELFQGIFGVKRLSPGKVKTVEESQLTHDCSTLEGSSGSPVVNLSTGEVVGIHFTGTYSVANYAVPSTLIADRLNQLL